MAGLLDLSNPNEGAIGWYKKSAPDTNAYQFGSDVAADLRSRQARNIVSGGQQAPGQSRGQYLFDQANKIMSIDPTLAQSLMATAGKYQAEEKMAADEAKAAAKQAQIDQAMKEYEDAVAAYSADVGPGNENLVRNAVTKLRSLGVVANDPVQDQISKEYNAAVLGDRNAARTAADRRAAEEMDLKREQLAYTQSKDAADRAVEYGKLALEKQKAAVSGLSTDQNKSAALQATLDTLEKTIDGIGSLFVNIGTSEGVKAINRVFGNESTTAWQTSASNYRAALETARELLTTMITGASATPSQIAAYKQMIPSATDTPESVREKIRALRNLNLFDKGKVRTGDETGATSSAGPKPSRGSYPDVLSWKAAVDAWKAKGGK
jgi:hypothetical protein